MTDLQTNILIRQMQPGEEKAVLSIMRRAFPLFMWLTFSAAMIRSAEQVLVACVDGQIKGGTLLKTFDLPGGGKGGVVDWIFSDPSGRGLGLGTRLMAAILDWFDQAGCDQIFAIIEGYNTNSSNLFARRGFSILSFKDQLKRYGFPGFMKVWLKTFHFFDLGHFLWAKPGPKTADSPSAQLSGTILLNLVIALLLGLRGWRNHQSWITLLALPAWVTLFLLLRNGLMAVSAAWQKEKLRFRYWETGFVISFLGMLLGGFFIPIPGSYYPEEEVWHYHRRKTSLGKMALAGSLPSLLIGWTLLLVGRTFSLAGGLNIFLSTGLGAALIFTTVDILLPFFPLVSYNSRRLWDWNKWVWGILAAAVLLMWAIILFVR